MGLGASQKIGIKSLKKRFSQRLKKLFEKRHSIFEIRSGGNVLLRCAHKGFGFRWKRTCEPLSVLVLEEETGCSVSGLVFGRSGSPHLRLRYGTHV